MAIGKRQFKSPGKRERIAASGETCQNVQFSPQNMQKFRFCIIFSPVPGGGRIEAGGKTFETRDSSKFATNRYLVTASIIVIGKVIIIARRQSSSPSSSILRLQLWVKCQKSLQTAILFDTHLPMVGSMSDPKR